MPTDATATMTEEFSSTLPSTFHSAKETLVAFGPTTTSVADNELSATFTACGVAIRMRKLAGMPRLVAATTQLLKRIMYICDRVRPTKGSPLFHDPPRNVSKRSGGVPLLFCLAEHVGTLSDTCMRGKTLLALGVPRTGTRLPSSRWSRR